MDSYLIYLLIIIAGALMFMFMEPSKGKVKVDLNDITPIQIPPRQEDFEISNFYELINDKRKLLRDLELLEVFDKPFIYQESQDQISFLIAYHDIDLSNYPNLNEKLNS